MLKTMEVEADEFLCPNTDGEMALARIEVTYDSEARTILAAKMLSLDGDGWRWSRERRGTEQFLWACDQAAESWAQLRWDSELIYRI